MSEEEKPTRANTLLPGVSYIPDKIEIAEKVVVQEKVAGEFLDFLDCITDLLELMHVIKVKHLRSMMPLPFDVVREVRYFKGKGPRFKAYEKTMPNRAAGISASVDNFLRSGISTASSVMGQGRFFRRPVHNKKENNILLKRRRADAELVDIVGKKTKPIWHVVALEKQETTATMAASKSKKDRRGTDFRLPAPHSEDISKSRSERLLFSIQFATSTKALPTDKVFKRQMDMMEAYFAGFSSVEAYQGHLETLKPHWFTDLLRTALSTGVVLTTDITDGFERLGKFYSMTCSSVPLARAKLCFILMSLPIWDVTRMTLQRAAEFIVREILLVPDPAKKISDWVTSRRLPYVVLPPIVHGCGGPPGGKEEEEEEKNGEGEGDKTEEESVYEE